MRDIDGSAEMWKGSEMSRCVLYTLDRTNSYDQTEVTSRNTVAPRISCLVGCPKIKVRVMVIIMDP